MFDTKDILLFENGNGGDLSVANNDIELAETLYQQVYLALFGGNVEAETRGDEPDGVERLDWWGNALFFEQQNAKQFNSLTEKTLNEAALNSTGRIAILRAVESDLSYLKTIADLQIDVVLLNVNQVQISVKLTETINTDNGIKLIWDNAKNEIITHRTI